MDQLNILKTIALPDPITGENLKDAFDRVNANFNTLEGSTYTAGKDGITRVHTLKFDGNGVADEDGSFKTWLTTQIGIDDKNFIGNIVKAFNDFDNSDWYYNRSYEIYIGSDNKVKEALPILWYGKKDDKDVISYLGFAYDTNGTLKLERKNDVLSIDDKGYWVVNGISTQVKARGIDGKDGANGSGLDFGVVTVISTEDEPNFLEINEYWSGEDNEKVKFNDLTADEKDAWFDDNKNKVFLFTYDEKPNNQEHPKTYMGYVTKIVTVNKEGTPSNTYGFYYSDNTIYSPGIGGSGDLITLLDNMSYTQSNSGKPRGIWFKNNKDDSAIFVYNDNNVLNIGKIEDYSSAYKTNEITTKATEVKINGSATVSGTTTLNGEATIKNGATINNSLTIGSTNTNQIVLSTATKNDSELGYYSGDKLIQVVGTRTVDDKQEYRVTTITPTKITSSDLKLIGGATINGTTNLGGSLTIGSTKSYNKELNLYGTLYCFGSSSDNRIGLYTANKDNSNLDLVSGNKYIQVGNGKNFTTIAPSKITSTNLKLDGNLTIGSTNTNQIVLSTATKNDSELGYYSGDKLIQVVGTRTVDDKQEYRVTAITPTKITSSDLKLIGGATINQNLDVGSITTNNLFIGGGFNGVIQDNSIYCDNIYSHPHQQYGYNLFSLNTTDGGGVLKLIGNNPPNSSTTISTTNTNICGDVAIGGSLKAYSELFTIDGRSLIFKNKGDGETRFGVYTAIDDKPTLGINTNDKYLQLVRYEGLNVNNNDIYKTTTITPTKITSSNIELNSDNILNIDDLVTTVLEKSNCFNYPKLIYKVLDKLKIVRKPENGPLSLSIDNKMIQTNFCNLYIKHCNVNVANYYYNDNKIYSVSSGSSNLTGNLYKISGYIIFTDGKFINNNNGLFTVDGINNKFGGDGITSTPNIIYIDDYFAFIHNDKSNKDIIITPYGVKNGKFIPHYNFSNAGGDNNIYTYNLNQLYSTTIQTEGGNAPTKGKEVGSTTIDESKPTQSVAAQSVICDCGVGGENFAFKLIYDI